MNILERISWAEEMMQREIDYAYGAALYAFRSNKKWAAYATIEYKEKVESLFKEYFLGLIEAEGEIFVEAEHHGAFKISVLLPQIPGAKLVVCNACFGECAGKLMCWTADYRYCGDYIDYNIDLSWLPVFEGVPVGWPETTALAAMLLLKRVHKKLLDDAIEIREEYGY